ncbi:phosphonate ABC transporter ATP-binding protein [Alginatibacterium sediminis]|uniref:Phosphonate ABC transporter ATP-binding protein n=1 Tax=Alginatibacterium sediminis TaxID=2164068 RepID=A0A420EL43_9ALTE|nr:phosphonate ABC transporter ATP-binding protein [Alginatibacterium sediminis]RKF21427.1 phosphonate ABC transporter ATP-binding protein [Alginatibacterium sediminis]
MTSTVIEVRKLAKHFGDTCALANIDLDVKQGEMLGLLGPSGSGKSTLLRHLNGLVRADKNSKSSIKTLGNDVQINGKFSRSVRTSRSQTGYIFQQHNLVSRLSVLQNVLIGALSSTPKWRSLSGNFTTLQKSKALQALDKVGLKQFAKQRVSTLSGGQQQRVAIARALMQDSKLILADEPIASLDPEASRTVMELLRSINKELGIAVVVTLHQVEFALEYCPRIVALKDGEIYFDGPSHDLNQSKIDQLYGATQRKAAEALPNLSPSLWPQLA